MMPKYESLKNKEILIVGATSGIGEKCAEDLAGQSASLHLVGRNEDRLNELKSKLNCSVYKADLTKEEDIDVLVEELPAIDGAVFSAGMSKTTLTRFIKDQDMEHVFMVNLFSTMKLCAQLQQKKKINKNASLVFMSSAVTKYPFVGGALYTSSKLALEGYVKVLAMELAPKKIRANCLAPNFVKTPFLGENEQFILEEAVEKHKNIHLLGMGETADVSNYIQFLLSGETKWVSGSTIYLGGGV